MFEPTRFRKRVVSKSKCKILRKINFMLDLFREFTNQEYQEDKESPREQAHFDYRFIKSPAGPLFKDDEANEGNALLEE